MNLTKALTDPIWINHKIGDIYDMINVNGTKDFGWKIAYYPLDGTYKGEDDKKVWVAFEEPRALIEKNLEKGTDFREVPLRYLVRQ